MDNVMATTSAALPPSADIVVAGGGPAGATISRLLAGFGFRVVVLEKHRFPRHQIGESLTPSILPILDFLGLRACVEAAGFLRMVGHTVCWGSPQPRTSFKTVGNFEISRSSSALIYPPRFRAFSFK